MAKIMFLHEQFLNLNFPNAQYAMYTPCGAPGGTPEKEMWSEEQDSGELLFNGK